MSARGRLAASDRDDLGRPEACLRERRERAQPVPERGCARVAADLLEPVRERLRAVERKHRAAGRVRVERVREPCLRPRRLVGERERALDGGRDLVRQAVDVLRALPLDARQRLALLLRLDHAGGRTADEQEVVSSAVRRLQAELAHRDASCRREVDGTRVLDRPARRREHAVDLDPGLRLGRQVCDSTVTHRRIFLDAATRVDPPATRRP